MGRYETFVIRVWIDKKQVVNHGEIRHPVSGAGRRFLRMEDAMAFIDHHIAHESEAAVSHVVDVDSSI